MGVRLGDPDLLAPVLKTEHLLHVGASTQLHGPVDEGVQHQVDTFWFQVVEGGSVVGGVTDHLAAPGAGAFGQQAGPGRQCAGGRAGPGTSGGGAASAGNRFSKTTTS